MQFALSIFGAADKLAVKLGEQVWGSGVDAELELHGAAHQIPDLDLHGTAQLQGKKNNKDLKNTYHYNNFG